MLHSTRALARGAAFFAALPLFALPSAAQAVVAPVDRAAEIDRLLQVGQEDNRVQEHLHYLTTGIGARLTSSTNLTRACEWARAQFESFGLEAHIEEWGTFPVGFDAGPHTGGMVAPEKIDYVYRTPAWTPGTPGPTRGRALLEPTTEEELEAIRPQLAGAWLVRGNARVRRSVREVLDAAIQEAGVAGEVRKGGDRITVFGNHRIEWDERNDRMVSVRLLNEHYDDLHARLVAGDEVELEFDIDNRFLPGPVPLYNVIADIPGTELPDEYVVIGGHIDSWHAAQGTNDNGTGVATTMEAARLLMASGAQPKRTIRFMLWSGEEQGLLGSRGWVNAHTDLMPKISAALVHDKGTNYLSGMVAPAKIAEQLRGVFEPVAELNPDMPFSVRENQGFNRMAGSSDHASFLREGVPGLFWEQSGRTTYGDFWHTHYDTFDSAVPEYQRHSALVVAVGALGIANLDGLLDRDGLFSQGGGNNQRNSTRRRMGVSLEDTEVTRVFEDSMAERAGWQEGDVIVSIDGVDVADRRAVVEQLQKGGPVKTVVLQREEERVTTTLDYTGTPSEQAREAQRRAEEEAAGEGEEEPAEEPAEGGGGR